MAKDFLIYIVDDDPMIQAALESILEDDFSLELFGSAEDCLAQLDKGAQPRMILLDVSLPAMDGYALCRLLKERDDTREISITFISAHDTIEARLTGYEAGGEDFVVKPFDVAEVRRKVDVTERRCKETARVKEQTQSAEQLTELLMASMNDYVALVSYLGKLAGAVSAHEVAEFTLDLLSNLGTEGVVQVRVKSGEVTMSKQGINLPLETSVMNHVRTMDRIFEFKNRCAFNYDRATIMLNNMPVQDPEACGRIRDSFAIAAQGADTRLQGIDAESQNRMKQEGIRTLLQGVAQSVAQIKQQQRDNQLEAADIVFHLQEDMMNSFVHLGLTEGQERYLENIVRAYAERLLGVIERGAESQKILEELSNDLQQLSD
jgi:CheY-like chemotaxis protein